MVTLWSSQSWALFNGTGKKCVGNGWYFLGQVCGSSSCTVLVLGPVLPHRWGWQMGKQLLQRMVFPRPGLDITHHTWLWMHPPHVGQQEPHPDLSWAVGQGGWNTKELFLFPLVSLNKFILTKKQAATRLLLISLPILQLFEQFSISF